VKNPLEKLDLKTWPDVLLAIFVLPFTIAFTALFPETSRDFAIPIVLIISGMLFFGLAGKISYYRFRDNTIKGNSNAWFSGWRHSILGNSIALVGVAQVLLGLIFIFMGTR
jgi:hypothetical protein